MTPALPKIARGQRLIEVHSPANHEKLGEVPAFSEVEATAALERAREAQRRWQSVGFAQRRLKLEAFLDALYAHAEEVSRLLSAETGKTIYESYMLEILPVQHLTAYFAKHAESILAPRAIELSLFKHRASYVHYKGRGVVLVVSPWNFPFSIPVGEVVMALLAGNAVLLKPSSLTPLIAYKTRELFDLAGLDQDLFQVISGPGTIASHLIGQGVDYVNFTGSTAVGRKVAALCGSTLTPYSMELGGKDPAIVLPDADLDKAARALVWGAFANAGQVCASVERVYAHRAIYDDLVERVVAHASKLRQGNPLDGGEYDIGAMTDPSQVVEVQRQIAAAVEQGARVLVGGAVRDDLGPLYHEPTVLVDVDESMDVVRDETFGPVLPIMAVATETEAISRANDSVYGLNAYVFTRDQAHGRRVAEQLQAGTVMVNEALVTHAFPETPWGGVKASGVGVVHSDDGLRALAQQYHVNYERLPAPISAWHPYTNDKLSRFKAAFTFVHRKAGLSGKLAALRGLIFGSSVET